MNERDIFIAALQKADPAERGAYLAETCGADDALRRRVEGLLEVYDRAGSFLEEPAESAGGTGAYTPPGAEALAAVPRPKAGAVIGPYKLLREIGEGGMGSVWMAEQTQPVQRKVALKLIKSGMDSRQVVARFEAERQALAMMDHVNIARVFDGGTTENGRPYFVMELVHGVPITKYCDDNHLTPRERLELFVPVCQALQHAHQKGIIHRDVKPSNVLITLYDGKPVPKVIDFGVAKATEQNLTERTLFTQHGTLVGTLEYMSPEQAELSGLGVDTRSDIYSLGVLLYELLTGSTPLTHRRLKEAAYGEILRMIREEEPPRPSTRLSDSGGALASISAQRHTEPAKLSKLVRGELDWIVMKTLEKDRNRRYATANGFAADVQRYLNDEPVQACPPTAGYRFRKFVRRHRRSLATVGLLVLTLTTGTVVSAWQAIRATEANGLTRAQLRQTEEAHEKATRRLYEARLAQAKAGSLSRRPGQRLDSLDALVEAAKVARDLNLPDERLLERRNAVIACLALPDLRLARQWPGWPAGSDHVDFDGKLEHYARADTQGAVSVRRVADDAEIARLPGAGAETWLLFSRDGKFLAVRSSVGLKVWKLGGDEPAVVVDVRAGDFLASDFSPDSRQFAVSHADGSIRVHDLAAGQPPRRLPSGRRATCLAFHPRSRQFAVSCNTSVEIRDLDSGKVLADLQQGVRADRLAWHPDGKTLAVGGGDRKIYLWDVAAGKQTLVLEGVSNGGTEIAFNHAGDLLASTCWDGVLRLWDPLTGRQRFSTPSGTPGTPPRFSLDDRLLTADIRDDKLGLWEVAATGEYRTLVRTAAAGNGIYQYAAIRSDGHLLAVAMQDGVGLWDLTGGKELTFIPLPGCDYVLFEPSGALLTNGSAGLVRWPVQAEPASPGLLRLGPPHQLSVPGPVCHAACSHDGRVIAISQGQGGRVLHADRPDQQVPLGPHDDARYVAVSPDGRLVATGSHTRTGVKVWEAQSGKLVKELPVHGQVGFSPDGKWLATSGGGLRMWAVGSWRKGPYIGGTAIAFAFSPDHKLLAVETGYGVLRLVDPDTGREYARLEDPNQDRAFAGSFSPDGTQLITTNGDSASIHVWDLRAIRGQLAKMALDWDLPPYPPAAPADGKPPQVQVDLGALPALLQAQAYGKQGLGYVQAKQWDKAIGAYTKSVELDPKNAETQNNLAWLLTTCPDARFRDPGRALELARKTVALAPQQGNAWNTLGVAHYRAGDWNAAVAALEKSHDLLGGKGLSFNAFFLAMAQWHLGNKDEARQWYGRAVAWMDKNAAQKEELRRFRAEASELLGIAKTKD